MKLPSIIKNTKKNSIKTIILLSFLSLVWTILIMGVVDKQLGVSDWIHQNWLQWLPEYFDISGVYSHPEQYSTGILVFVLILTFIVGVIIGPFIEEIYFQRLEELRPVYLQDFMKEEGILQKDIDQL